MGIESTKLIVSEQFIALLLNKVESNPLKASINLLTRLTKVGYEGKSGNYERK